MGAKSTVRRSLGRARRLRMPLAEAVALDEAILGAGGQADGFGNECEGHCGV